MESKTMKTRISAVAVALAMLLSLVPMMVLADDAYGMQGAKKHIQMIDPSDITVNSAADTEYVNTLNAPVALTDGKASFQFKMDGFGGNINNASDKVVAMQGKVDAGVTLTDANGSAVSGSSLTVTAVDTSAVTFDLDVGGLAENTSYILTFLPSFATGGGNWTLDATIKFNFTTAGETEPDPDPETPTGETLVNYTDEQATSPDGTVFNIKFTYIDGEANQTDVPLYKVGDNRYRIDGLLDIDGMFRGTFKFRNAYGGRNYSDLYAGIYADPADLSEVASGDPIEWVDRNFENDTMFAIDPSALLPGTTYYFVIKAATNNGNQNFGSDVVFELKTAGEAPAPADPVLVSSEGNDLKARTNTTLTLENAPAGEGYTYKFIVYNTTTNQWYKLQDFSDATTFDWYTGPAGVKNLYVDIKDADGNVTRVALEGVNVTDSDLAVTSFTSSEGDTLTAKTRTALKAVAEKGTEPYQYKFIVHNNDNDQWYKIQDFSEANICDWYTGPAGNKTLYVDVKDATGKVVRSELPVTVQ